MLNSKAFEFMAAVGNMILHCHHMLFSARNENLPLVLTLPFQQHDLLLHDLEMKTVYLDCLPKTLTRASSEFSFLPFRGKQLALYHHPCCMLTSATSLVQIPCLHLRKGRSSPSREA